MMNAAHMLTQRQPVLVVGLGLTGWSVVRFLKRRGKDVVVMDSRSTPPFLDALQATYPEVTFHDLKEGVEERNYADVVASPGVQVRGAEAIGDIELFAREVSAPVVAVTGSNGKSTVTMLVQRMLNCSGTTALAGGNLGTPALDLLEEPVPDFYVLELSSFQLETTDSLRPAAAVVLNLSEDHMDRYHGLHDYLAAKLRIHQGATCRVFNREETAVPMDMRRDHDLTFGLDRPEEGSFGVIPHAGEPWIACGSTLLVPVSALTLKGTQNLANMLAALALVQGALQGTGYSLDQHRLQAGLTWQGLPHRCEPIPTRDGVCWINDSKGTNVGATLAAIRGAGRPLVLIAGGQGKGADFSPLQQVMDDSIRGVILIGEDAGRIAASLGSTVPILRERSLTDAVIRARNMSHPGDTVLFSPACASFDMFDSFAHRGDCFRHLVVHAGSEDGSPWHGGRDQ